MHPAKLPTKQNQALNEELRIAVEKTQRFLRHTFRKVLTENCDADIAEQGLYIQAPHVHATWTCQTVLIGAGIKVGVRFQFDIKDGRLLQKMQSRDEAESPLDEQVLQKMQDLLNAIGSLLQRRFQDLGLMTSISQATITKAFERIQGPQPILKGGVIDSWLLRVDDCSLYCMSQLIVEQNRDIVALSQ